MRLLNTSSYTLTTFYDSSVPPYAILSHRWEAEEVTFQDLLLPTLASLAGHAKLLGCCKQALSEGWEWVWIDTCCIDKTSSAEISEAINSMFKWYKEAGVCYAYLSDVSPGLDWQDHHVKGSQFRGTKWWTRGWTLQELLAPQSVVFYDREWGEIGTKSSMSRLVSETTGIKHLTDFSDASVAQKMSWAAKRKTTRVEDEAYCLIGIFGVHMPPLYGEGKNAFLRLQLEILKHSEDESIFAWSFINTSSTRLVSNLLADSPRWFLNSANVKQSYNTLGLTTAGWNILDHQGQPSMMTNRGFRMEVILFRVATLEHTMRYWLPLNCTENASPIALMLLGESSNRSKFSCSRGSVLDILPDVVQQLDTPQSRRTIYVQIQLLPSVKWVEDLTIFFKCGIDGSYELGTTGTVIIDDLEEGLSSPVQISAAQTNIEFGDSKKLTFTTYVTPGHPEQFILKFSYYSTKQPLAMKLSISEGPELKDIVLKRFEEEGAFALQRDRVSRLLPSGKSISAALKRTPGINQNSYVVELSIDTTGKLRWPDQNTLT